MHTVIKGRVKVSGEEMCCGSEVVLGEGGWHANLLSRLYSSDY